MSPRAKSAAAALLCLTLTITAMATLGLNWTLRLIAQELIDTAEGAGAGIYERIRVSLLQAGDDPVKSLQDDVELQNFLRTLRASQGRVIFAQVETAGGEVIPSAEEGTANWISKGAPSIEDLRRELRAPIPLALLSTLWGSRTFVFRRPALYDGHDLGIISVGVSSALMADNVRAQTGVLAGGAILTLGLTWLVFRLFASRPSTAFESSGAGAAGEPIRARVRKRHLLPWAIARIGTLPEPFGASDGNVGVAQNSLVELLESIRDGALMVDGRGVVGFANSKARLLLGPQAAMPGKSIRDALGGEHPIVQILEAAIAGPARPQHVQLRLYGSQNRFGAITVSTFPVNHGLVVLLGEPAPIDEMQDDSWTSTVTGGSHSKGAARRSGLVEITVSEQGKVGIHPRYLRELLDLYFATHDQASGPALVLRAQELHRGINRQQVDNDPVIARVRLDLASAQGIQPVMPTSNGVALAQSEA
jgi:PAS domain-containing protein